MDAARTLSPLAFSALSTPPMSELISRLEHLEARILFLEEEVETAKRIACAATVAAVHNRKYGHIA